MQRDSEERQIRAIAAMDAIECLLEMTPREEMLPAHNLAALISVVNDAIRDALPKAAAMVGVNDTGP